VQLLSRAKESLHYPARSGGAGKPATVAVIQLSGVTGANATLRNLGLRVVLVPVKDGCPSIISLPAPHVSPGKVFGSINLASGSRDGTMTVQAKGIPAGDLLVIAVASTGHGTEMSAGLTVPPAPACVTLLAGIPGPGSGQVRGSAPGGAPGPGTTVVLPGPGSGQGPA
jgi:hypothetical protein